jgi:hypothetical protein
MLMLLVLAVLVLAGGGVFSLVYRLFRAAAAVALFMLIIAIVAIAASGPIFWAIMRHVAGS